MPPPKEAPQRKRRRRAVPALSAAGLLLSLANGASGAVGGMSAWLPARTGPGQSTNDTA